jgi:hypothetical protein
LPDEVIDLFQRFKAGDDAAYWGFVLHARVQRVLQYQRGITRSRYKLSAGETEDFEHELILNLRRRLQGYQVDVNKDEVHQANGLFRYMQLALLGESDKAARYVKGMMTRDERGYASIKGFKLSIDHEGDGGEGDAEGDFSMAAHKAPPPDPAEGDQAAAVRRLMFNYLMRNDQECLYRAVVLHYDKGLSWNDVARQLNLRTTEKQAYARQAARLIALVRAFLFSQTGMKVEVTIMGVHTTESNVSMCMLFNDNTEQMWAFDYVTQDDLNTVEGKVSDWLRQYDITFVVMNSQETNNHADVLIERILHRRSILYERIDLIDLIPKLPGGYEKLKRKRPWDDNECGAWVVARAKKAELEIARRA